MKRLILSCGHGTRHRLSTYSQQKLIPVAKTLIKLYGSKIKSEITNKYRVRNIRHCFADISKIKKLEYEPKASFEEGMKELVEWASKIEAKDRFDKAYKELEERRLVGK